MGCFPPGKIWEGCKDIWSQDIREYISEPWNLLDFSILTIFMTSFIARLMAFWHAYSAQCYVDEHFSDWSNRTLPFEIQYFQLGKFEKTTEHRHCKNIKHKSCVRSFSSNFGVFAVKIVAGSHPDAKDRN